MVLLPPVLVRLASAVVPPTAPPKVLLPWVVTVRVKGPLTVAPKVMGPELVEVRVVLVPKVTAPSYCCAPPVVTEVALMVMPELGWKSSSLVLELEIGSAMAMVLVLAVVPTCADEVLSAFWRSITFSTAPAAVGVKTTGLVPDDDTLVVAPVEIVMSLVAACAGLASMLAMAIDATAPPRHPTSSSRARRSRPSNRLVAERRSSAFAMDDPPFCDPPAKGPNRPPSVPP